MPRLIALLLLLTVALGASACVQTNALTQDHADFCLWHPSRCDTNGYN